MKKRTLVIVSLISAVLLMGAGSIGYQDWQLRGSAPGNPASTFLRTWADNTAGAFKCLTSAGASCYWSTNFAGTYNTGTLPVANGGTGTTTPGIVAGSNITSVTGTWPNQTINAAAGSGGMTLISTQVLGSAAATVTFSSIAGTYTSLRLVWTARSSTAGGGSDWVYVQANGDTGNNYGTQYILGLGAAAGEGQAVGTNKPAASHMTTTGDLANAPGTAYMDFPFYAGTTFYKAAISVSASYNGGGQNNLLVTTEAWNWYSTSAITQLLIGVQSGVNFITGSTFALYGIS